jgi:carbonic anhydrase/acetyltransferase-like protein (isoleucine patch superfamily)
MTDKKTPPTPKTSPLASICSYEGKWPKIDASAFVADGARIIGNVTIQERANIWFNVVIRGDVNSIFIGADTNIQDNAVVHVTHKAHATHIGSGVTVGHLALLHGCTVGDHCLVGMHAVVMDGAEIGEESLIGAGSVVTQGTKIPPRSLVLGSPAKVVRPLRDAEIAALHDSAKRYTELPEGYNFETGCKPATAFV